MIVHKLNFFFLRENRKSSNHIHTLSKEKEKYNFSSKKLNK